jgi:hypothetical protein
MPVVKKLWAVSAVLRWLPDGHDPKEISLVLSFAAAETEEEAIGAFVKYLIADRPGQAIETVAAITPESDTLAKLK